jgi:alpha-glucoside transport system substrate-binding protein
MRHRIFLPGVVAALVTALMLVAVACGSGSNSSSSSSTPSAGGGGAAPTKANNNVKGSLTMMAKWSGDEQKSFQKVLDQFQKLYPNVTVKFTSAGNELPTVLATAVAGGNPPDIAVLPQPGLMQQFISRGALKPINFAKSYVHANFSPSWVKLGTVNGKLYGIFFKGANKSTVWYNVPAFKSAGVKPPTTWKQLLTAAKTLKASGVPAYSIGADVGWPLTDMFENIYLRTAGPAMYDKLTKHQIKWTDKTVTVALKDMAKIIGDTGNVAGGTSGAVQADFPTSVTNAFTDPPKGAMVFEGDFVESVITSSTSAKPRTGFNYFPFPSIKGSSGRNYVVSGGDEVVMFKDSPAARALIKYLATPQAAEIWAKLGGFSSPNKNVPGSVYLDPIGRKAALAMAKSPVVRYDMSDQAPAEFGSTVGQGEWQIFINFLKNPSDVSGTQQALETAAAKAFGK